MIIKINEAEKNEKWKLWGFFKIFLLKSKLNTNGKKAQDKNILFEGK